MRVLAFSETIVLYSIHLLFHSTHKGCASVPSLCKCAVPPQVTHPLRVEAIT